MKLLVVAMPGSVHTARWLAQIADQGWDVHLFPSLWEAPHPLLRRVTVHTALVGARTAGVDGSVTVRGIWPFEQLSPTLYWLANGRTMQRWLKPAHRLARTIRRLQPDIVHSLEFQHSAYLTLAAFDLLGGKVPPWIVTPWGSDIFLFGRLAAHRERVKAVLSRCSYLLAESERDRRLAGELGFRGLPLPVMPLTGGFDLAACAGLRTAGPTATRKTIVLKGYQHFAGRALVGLRAIARCAETLKRGFRVVVYAPSPDVAIAAELLAGDTGVPVELLDRCPHEEMLRLHGAARVSLGISISDGVPNSLLEAMAMGAFPIESEGSCAGEWIEDGVTGLVVPAEDPAAIAAALSRALADDGLVNRAAERNLETVGARLDPAVLRAQAVAMYRSVLEERRTA
jgi:glycosyltransferase involved in cell wall biosynthesis